jgi:hypothetical protein
MQHVALEIGDHRIIGCAMRQCLSNLLFEHVLSPFKIENVIWLRHDILRFNVF